MALAASIGTILKRISGTSGDDKAGRGPSAASTPAKRLAPVFDAIDETVRPRLLTVFLGDDARLEMMVGGRGLIDAVAAGSGRSVSAEAHDGKSAVDRAVALAPLLMVVGQGGGNIRVRSAPLSRPAAVTTGAVGVGDLRRICEKIDEASLAAASEAAVQALLSGSGGAETQPAEQAGVAPATPHPGAGAEQPATARATPAASVMSPDAAGGQAAEAVPADPSGWRPTKALNDMFEALRPSSTRIVLVSPSGTLVRSEGSREGLEVQALATELLQDMVKWARATESGIGGRSLVMLRPAALDGQFLCMMEDDHGIVAASVEVKAMARIVALERARWAAG